MTEPNIVYIGDAVTWRMCEQFTVVAGRPDPDEPGAYELVAPNGNAYRAMRCETPDGRPVDGFGGAKITTSEVATDIWECRIKGFELDSFPYPTQREAAHGAVAHAEVLYGEWVREPTESDLRRRGLL